MSADKLANKHVNASEWLKADWLDCLPHSTTAVFLQKQKSLTYIGGFAGRATEINSKIHRWWMKKLWLHSLGNNSIANTDSSTAQDGVATSETLRNTGAATSPLQAVNDAARRTMGESVQFSGSSLWKLVPGTSTKTPAPNVRERNGGVHTGTCSGSRSFADVKAHVTSVKTWKLPQWFGPIICCCAQGVSMSCSLAEIPAHCCNCNCNFTGSYTALHWVWWWEGCEGGGQRAPGCVMRDGVHMRVNWNVEEVNGAGTNKTCVIVHSCIHLHSWCPLKLSYRL